MQTKKNDEEVCVKTPDQFVQMVEQERDVALDNLEITGRDWNDLREQLTAAQAEAGRLREALEIDKLVNLFLAWPLPDSVCSDLCATKQGYPHRSGTTLLSASEAKLMITYILQQALTPPVTPCKEVDNDPTH